MAELTNGALTLDSALARLLVLFDLNANVDREIAFGSLHFHELKMEEMDELPVEIVEAIVCHPSLKLQDEDSLFDFIRRAAVRDRRFAALLANVRLEHLSRDSIESFVGLISECFEFLSAAVWESVAKRLLLSVSPPEDRDRFFHAGVECGYSGARPLNGIIAHLSRKGGGSVIDTGAVSVTASGIGSPQFCPLRVLADFGCGINCFCTPDVPNSWVCYDFGRARVRLTHYAVRSALKVDQFHLRSWKFEGSVDGTSWIVLDNHMNDATLTGAGAIAVFKTSRAIEVRMVRLCHTGKNSRPSDQMVLSALELFGWIFEPSQ
jgi:hypothetical protein